MRKIRIRLLNDIYFSPRAHRRLKRMALKLELIGLQNWDSRDQLPEKKKNEFVSVMKVAAMFKGHLADADEFNKSAYLTQRTFRLFRHTQRRSVVIVTHFYKPFEKIYKYNSLLLPAGFPTKKHPRRIGSFVREKVDLTGYVKKDEGTFNIRFRMIDCKYELAGYNTYIGKKKYRLQTTLKNLKGDQWVKRW